MKLTVFLLISVTVSHQQFVSRTFHFPWISPRFAQQQPMLFEYPHHYNPRYDTDHYYDGIQDDGHFNLAAPPVIIVTRVREEEQRASPHLEMPRSNYMTQGRNHLGGSRSEPKVKNYNRHQPDSSFGNEPEKRFFFTKQYHGYKTATFTVYSTCTAVTFSSCIPRNFFVIDVDAPVPNCRRKRLSEPHLQADDTDSQFAIVPSEIRQVTPTEQPEKVSLIHDGREISTEIMSSKEVAERGSQLGDFSSTSDVQVKNKRRFLYLWPSISVTGITSTSWSVISTILTSTLIPADIFFCLPPGYVVCL